MSGNTKDVGGPPGYGIKSLACATDLIFPRFSGLIEDHGDYLCVQTPDNPDYMWGNFLLFKAPPKSGDFVAWTDAYRRHFSGTQWFATFGWDGGTAESGVLREFTENGFTLESATVLALRHLSIPSTLRHDIVVKPIVDDQGWSEVLRNHIAFLCSGSHREEQARFEEARFASYRAIAARGHGLWFGAYLEDHLVGDLGIFFERRRARFQEVLTYPNWRKTGVCRTLGYFASRYVLENREIELIVTVTNDQHARSAYESFGFKPDSTVQGLRWYDLALRS